MKKLSQKGFTLIELLVVVAIIGVLATVVLSNLSAARDRAKDAKIKTLMNQMKTQAELFALDHGSYHGTATGGSVDDSISECLLDDFNGSVFDSDTTNNFSHIVSEVTDMTSDISIRARCAVGGSANDSWAFAVPLFNPGTGLVGWCVDSSGNSKEVNINLNTYGDDLGVAGGLVQCP